MTEVERLLAKERLGLTVEDAERRAAEVAARAERDAETAEKLRAYAAALRGVPQPTVTDPHALAAVEAARAVLARVCVRLDAVAAWLTCPVVDKAVRS